MQFLFDFIASVLATFYGVYNSYGFAIIALTLCVMLITTPLTLKSTRSMMMMQQLQPEIKKIQSKYKDDRQKQNEEVMRFYKENNLNPAGGCLPMVVQAPVFIVLYQVLIGLTHRTSDLGFTSGFNLGQVSSGVTPTKAPHLFLNFAPDYLEPSTELYQSLVGRNTMMGFGLDLSRSASEVLSTDGIVAVLPYLMLILVVAATGWYQQKQIQGRTPNAEINPQQQMLMKVMPFFLPVFSFTVPSGLVVYFVVSNVFRVGLQAYISRSIYGMKGGKPSDPPAVTKPVKGGKPPADPPSNGSDPPNAKRTKQTANASTGKATNGNDANGSASSSSSSSADKGKVSRPTRSSGETSDEGGGSGKKPRPTSKPSGNNTTKTTQSRGRDTPSGSKESTSASSPTVTPTLQPRARKPKKR